MKMLSLTENRNVDTACRSAVLTRGNTGEIRNANRSQFQICLHIVYYLKHHVDVKKLKLNELTQAALAIRLSSNIHPDVSP